MVAQTQNDEIMVISDHPKYLEVLGGIIDHLKTHQVESLLMGRKGIVTFWLNSAKSTLKIGEKSIAILTRDINYIIDKVYGYDFQ